MPWMKEIAPQTAGHVPSPGPRRAEEPATMTEPKQQEQAPPTAEPWRPPAGRPHEEPLHDRDRDLDRDRDQASPPQSPALQADHSHVETPATSLSFDSIVTRRSARPATGWRAAVYALTAGRWNPGPSRAEEQYLERVSQIRTLLPGRHVVTVTSMKGGIGKTTTAALLGLALAEYRGDHVIALDANPDAGTLAERLLGVQPIRNVRDLLANADRIEYSTDLARVTERAGRLQVLASEQDPLLSEAFTAAEYHRVIGVLRRFCEVIITDTGTGLVHSAMQGALAETHSIIVTGAPTADGASLASRTLDWLERNGHRDLVERAIVVLSCDRVSRDINLGALRQHFKSRCRDVVEIPPDPHLAKGQQIHLDELRPRTRDAALHLAGLVASQFKDINDLTHGRELG